MLTPVPDYMYVVTSMHPQSHTYQSTYCVGPYDARMYRTQYIPTDISVLVPRRHMYCTHTIDELIEYAALTIQAHTNGQPNCRRYAVSD